MTRNAFFKTPLGLGMAAVVALSAGLILTTGCESKTEKRDQAQPKTTAVYTTFYPTTYFAERIAGDQVKIVNPCPADADPAMWMPSDKQLEEYQSAALIVINGASFEKWVDKANLPPSRIIDTTKPFKDEFITFKKSVTHSHGPEGEHTHQGIDGHTWLDPVNCMRQAEVIRDALNKQFPEHRAAFEKSFAELTQDLTRLAARHTALGETLGDTFLLCSHPAYNYVGRRYNWRLENFHLDPEEMPADEMWNEIKAFLDGQPPEQRARLMLWEAEPTTEIAKRMKDELGLGSVVFSPCEALDADALAKGENFFTVMNANIDRLESALVLHQP
ncbi:MAG: zinc ABC transporter substrate-binding protein [Phycisphaerae bacterium]|nr:zinc ABC transporter substrate-binding protein [Phycisphaerae bacterium]